MRLCQRDGASCGACCGLYNRADPSRGRRSGRSSARGAPARSPASRARGGLPGRRGARSRTEAPAPLFPSVRVCPLLGFLDAARDAGRLPRPPGGHRRPRPPRLRRLRRAHLRRRSSARATPGSRRRRPPSPRRAPRRLPPVRPRRHRRAVPAGGARGRSRRRRARGSSCGTSSTRRFRAALRRLLALKEELAPGSDGLFGAFRAGPGRRARCPRGIDYAALGRGGLAATTTLLTCAGADPRSGNDLDRFEAEVSRGARRASRRARPSAPPRRRAPVTAFTRGAGRCRRSGAGRTRTSAASARAAPA